MGGEAAKQAELGMALFKKEEEAEFDTEAAQKFKDAADEEIKQLSAEAEALTGKDNKKARKSKEKEASDKKVTKEYIDAVKVLKGVKPPNGHFIKTASSVAEAKAESPKPTESPDAKAAPAEKDDKKKAEK